MKDASLLMNNQAYDVAVVGSGAAGLTAACVAASMGQKVVVIEQSPYVGGTSAISGGMLWIPGHPYLAQNGLKDSPQNVRQYLENFIAKPFDARMEAFLAHCSPALQYLEKHTHLRTRPVTGYPDYYSELDGASIGCRVLEPEPFDGKLLGKHFHLLRAPLPEFMVFGGMMVSRQDIPLLRKARQGKSLTAVFNAASLVFEYLTQRIFHPRGTRLYLGNALVARLFKSALDLNIDFLLNASAKEIIFDSGNITGIIVKEDNNDKKINVAKGVILATGGLSHDHTLRNQYFSEIDSFKSATISRGDSLSGAKIAMMANAKISDNGKNGVFGVPLSHYVRPDGSEVYYPHTVTDRSKPGLIAVNAVGRRFTNEARSYHDFYYSQLE
ncbi:MAG: FAD-dependent oxidoreductase [Comamonas sp.]|nr:FAD-dependent oxidoreductase [Comamonas sp.]